MIIKNTSTEIGDCIQIIADTPIIGLITLLSFVDETEDETGTRFFTKQFQYSIDGVTYSPLTPLTNGNLQLITVQSNDTFYARYYYTRSGSDTSGTIAFDSVTLSGTYTDIVTGPAYAASNFTKYFVLNNICSIAWSVNVLEKLYKKGLLPNYIERDFNGTNATDRDFLDFWRAVTHYYALFVCLARQFQTFYTNQALLLEYLVQRGLFICSDEDLADMIYLMSNYYDQIRQRGTRQVFLPKDHEFSTTVKQVDGEYLRLICKSELDEFIYNLNHNKHIGWNIGNSSPLYKGLEARLNTNKYYCDFIDDINSVNELSIATSSLPYVSIVRDFDLDDESISVSESDSSHDSYARVIKISPPLLNESRGLGKGDKRIIINPNIDYEITFFIRSDSTAGVDPKIVFGVDCWDKNDNVVTPFNISTYANSTVFLNEISLNQEDKYYFVRGILYNKHNYKPFDTSVIYVVGNIVVFNTFYYRCIIQTEENQDPDTYPAYWQLLSAAEIAASLKTNLGVGNNLIFKSSTVKIDPYILYSNSNGSGKDLFIYNIRVQPLSTNYSKGFLNLSNLLELWTINNNQKYSSQEIDDITKKYLIPANVVLKNNVYNSELLAEEDILPALADYYYDDYDLTDYTTQSS